MTIWTTACFREQGRLWVRLLGFGLMVKDIRRHRLTFIDGVRRTLRLGPYRVRLLTPWS